MWFRIIDVERSFRACIQSSGQVQSWLTKVPVRSKNIKFGPKWVENRRFGPKQRPNESYGLSGPIWTTPEAKNGKKSDFLRKTALLTPIGAGWGLRIFWDDTFGHQSGHTSHRIRGHLCKASPVTQHDKGLNCSQVTMLKSQMVFPAQSPQNSTPGLKCVEDGRQGQRIKQNESPICAKHN